MVVRDSGSSDCYVDICMGIFLYSRIKPQIQHSQTRDVIVCSLYLSSTQYYCLLYLSPLSNTSAVLQSSIPVLYLPQSSIPVLYRPQSSIPVLYLPQSSIPVLYLPQSSIPVLYFSSLTNTSAYGCLGE